MNIVAEEVASTQHHSKAFVHRKRYAQKKEKGKKSLGRADGLMHATRDLCPHSLK